MAGSPLPTVFGFLADEENVALDAALVEALPHMDGSTGPAALKLLIKRNHVPSQVALIGGFAELEEPLRTLVAEHVGDFFSAVRAAVESSVLAHRKGAIALIVETRCGPLVYLLADALRRQCQQTKDLAAEGLHGLTKDLLKRFDDGPDAGELASLNALAQRLAEALERVVLTWEIHRRSQTLEAALWMSDRVSGAIRKKLEEPRTKIAHAICKILSGTSDPRLAGFALRALAVPALRKSAVSAIGQASDARFRRAVLAQSSLLIDAEIERACRWIRESRWLHGSVDELLGLGKSEAASAVSLLNATGGSHDQRIALLRELACTESVEIQTAVGWQLINDQSDVATDLLATLAARCSSEMGRIATRELEHRGRGPNCGTGFQPVGRPALTSRRAENQSGGVRPAQQPQQEAPVEASAHLAARRAFERYWQEFDRLGPGELQELTEAMREIADGVLVSIREKLSSDKSQDRCRAVRVARALSLSAALQKQIYPLSYDPDPVVRSTTISALCDLPGPTTRRILRQALNDRDDRVQANAIEVLEMLGEHDRLAMTASKLSSPNARIRANAVKSLLCLEVQDAGVALVEMLGDPSRAHRISALWVVERLGLQTVLERVRELARNDPDSQVRQRAHRVLSRLGLDHDVPADSRRPLAEDVHTPPILETH